MYIFYDLSIDFSTFAALCGPLDLHFGPKMTENLVYFVKNGASGSITRTLNDIDQIHLHNVYPLLILYSFQFSLCPQ